MEAAWAVGELAVARVEMVAAGLVVVKQVAVGAAVTRVASRAAEGTVAGAMVAATQVEGAAETPVEGELAVGCGRGSCHRRASLWSHSWRRRRSCR